MSEFAYTVAIRLTVANLASQGIRMLGKDLLAAHGQAVKLEDKLKALKLIAVGYGMEKVGQGMLGFMGKAIDASKDYTHQLALMNAAGFTHKELAGSIASAWKTSGEVLTSTAAGNLETIRELRSAFGKGEGMEHAYAVLSQVQRASAIMDSITGKHQERVGFDMVKAIEFGTKGALSVQSLMTQSEMMTKALVQMGGTLTVNDFHAAIKQSRAMAPYLSDDFKYNYMPTLMQEMKSGQGGAESAGTVLASLGQVVVGHSIQKELIANWIKAGLIAPNMVVADPHNRTTSKILPGGVAGQNTFAANAEVWAQQYAAPAVARLMASEHLDQFGAILALTKNRVAAFGLQTLINKDAQFQRDRKLITQGPDSLTSYNRLLQADPQMAQIALHSQWQNILAQIGYQILPVMIPYMVKFANSLSGISQWMTANQGTVKAAAMGFLGLGAALAGMGKILMTVGIIRFLGVGPLILRGLGAVAAFLGGPFTVVIAAFGVAAYLAYQHWDYISKSFTTLWGTMKSGFTSFVNFIIGLLNHLPLVHIAPISSASSGSPFVRQGTGAADPSSHDAKCGRKETCRGCYDPSSRRHESSERRHDRRRLYADPNARLRPMSYIILNLGAVTSWHNAHEWLGRTSIVFLGRGVRSHT